MREHAKIGTEVWDGMRGIAVLLVMVYHTWLFSWYTPSLVVGNLKSASFVRTGYLGVEIFFVISGFVLFLPYARAAAGGTTMPTIAEFARRRFLKIVPSYVIALAFTVASALTLTPKPMWLLASIANHLGFYQNFYNDQLGGANSVFWSLAIEVQFYLVFPAIAWAFARRPFLVAGAMVAAAIAYRTWAAHCCLQVEPVTRQLPAYLDLFACGMFSSYAVVRWRATVANPERYAIGWTLLAGASIVAAVVLVCGADDQTYVPGGKEQWIATHRTLFGLTIATFGVASSLGLGWWRRAIANPVLGFVAIISYNLYLWHTIVLIWMWKHDVPHAITKDPHDDPHWKLVYVPAGWLTCFAIATATTYFIERPLLGSATRPPFSFGWRLGRIPSIVPSEKRI